MTKCAHFISKLNKNIFRKYQRAYNTLYFFCPVLAPAKGGKPGIIPLYLSSISSYLQIDY